MIRTLLSLYQSDSFFVTFTFLLTNIIRLLSSLILTRVLSPDAFGVIGVLMSVVYIVTMLSDVGFQAFLLMHERGASSEVRGTVWLVRLLRSAIISFVMVIASGPVCEFLGKESLAPALRVLCLVFFLDGLSSISTLSALRDKQLRRISVMDLIVLALQVLVSVVLALYFRSYWALIYAIIGGYIVRLLLSYAMFRGSKFSISFSVPVFREIIRFGKYISSSNVLTVILTQADKVALAKLFSIHSFGLYAVASNLSSIPSSFAASIATKALYPRYTEVWQENGSALREVFGSSKFFIVSAYVSSVAFLIGSAPLVINVLYDRRYADSAIYLSVLSAAALPALHNQAANHVLTAIGKIEANLTVNLARVASLMVTGPTGYFLFGPIGIPFALVATEVVALVYHWKLLRSNNLLSLRSELVPFAFAIIFASAGFLTTMLSSYVSFFGLYRL